jgi:predicted RNA-binding protein with PUA-like domain
MTGKRVVKSTKGKSTKGKSAKANRAKGTSAKTKRATAKTAPTKSAPPKSGGAWTAVLAPRKPGEKRFWLVKSEPSVFSFDDLLRIHNKTTHWNGVRNFVARTFMKDGMKLGDRVFFYHSSTDPTAIVGICEVVREAYPDDSAFDSSSEGYDPSSTMERPTWYMVDIRAVAQFTRPVTLEEIKQRKELASMTLLRIGRLSVSPVSPTEWDVICRMAG